MSENNQTMTKESVIFLITGKDIPEIRAIKGDQILINSECGLDQVRIMHALKVEEGKFLLMNTDEVEPEQAGEAHPVIGVCRSCERG